MNLKFVPMKFNSASSEIVRFVAIRDVSRVSESNRGGRIGLPKRYEGKRYSYSTVRHSADLYQVLCAMIGLTCRSVLSASVLAHKGLGLEGI